MEELVADIDCEFQNAVRYQMYERGRTWLKTWQGQYTVTLKGNETGIAKGTSSTTPILLPRASTLNLGFGGGVTTTANRTGLLKFNLDFASVGPGPYCVPPLPASGHPMLTGKIGFAEWMDRSFAGALADGTIRGKTTDITSVGHTFEFSLDLTANATPVFTIMPVPATTLSPTGSIDRFEDNIVDVSLGKAASGTETVTKTAMQYTKSQTDAINDLKKAIDELTAKIAESNKTLTANKAFIEQGEKLKPFIGSDLAVKGKFPNANPEILAQQQHDASDFFKDPTAEKKLNDFKEMAAAVKVDQATLDAKKGQLLDTLNHPASQTVVQHQVRASSPLSADLNPNVTNTQLQLTFERLNNNLRIPTP